MYGTRGCACRDVCGENKHLPGTIHPSCMARIILFCSESYDEKAPAAIQLGLSYGVQELFRTLTKEQMIYNPLGIDINVSVILVTYNWNGAQSVIRESVRDNWHQFLHTLQMAWEDFPGNGVQDISQADQNETM